MESSINRYLALDPAAGNSLDSLENKCIKLQLREFAFPLFFQIENRRIKVLSSTEESTDVVMSTSIPVLMNITLLNRDENSILGSELEMSGNMEIGRQFRDVFSNLNIDWEEILSKYTGDIIAHKLGNGVRHFNRWVGNSSQLLQQNITEYLQEESKQLPQAEEVNAFIKQVDAVRSSVERAEVRLNMLNSKLEKKNE